MNWQDLTGEIAEADLIAALDDNKDGLADEDVWAAIQASAAERAVNAYGAEVPAVYAAAASYAQRVFCLEILFRRRGYSGDRNPFYAQANAAEKRLTGLSVGEDRPDATPGGAHAETEPTRTRPSSGGLLV